MCNGRSESLGTGLIRSCCPLDESTPDEAAGNENVSGKSMKGGEPGCCEGTTGRPGLSAPTRLGALGKYPPPSELALFMAEDSIGDTPPAGALW